MTERSLVIHTRIIMLFFTNIYKVGYLKRVLVIISNIVLRLTNSCKLLSDICTTTVLVIVCVEQEKMIPYKMSPYTFRTKTNYTFNVF